MKKIISLILTITLSLSLFACGKESGNELEFEHLEWPNYENAKQIPIPKSTMADVRNSNAVRFEFYLANTTLEDYKAYVEECKAKGFTFEAMEQENRYYAFNEGRYELTVQHQEGDIMYVSVVEERYEVEVKLIHTDKSSADMYDIRVEIDGFWEEDSEKGDEVISFETDLREGEHTLVIENDDDDEINGRIDFVVSENGEYFEFEIKCLSNKIELYQSNVIASINNEPQKTEDSETINSEYDRTDDNQVTETAPDKETISLSEAKTIFTEIFVKYDVLVDDFGTLLDYCNNTSFTSVAQIQELERQWLELSDTAYDLANELLAITPPEECKAEWDAFANKLKELGALLFITTSMDANLDNHYDGDEMESVINMGREGFVEIGEDIIEIAESFDRKVSEKTESSQDITPSKPSNNTTSTNAKKCEECGNPATKNIDLFGQTEYYCTTHYNDIMDVIDMMETDVGKGTASKHTCEVCSKEGTRTYHSFTGQTEYYCTQHYNELMDMFDALGMS